MRSVEWETAPGFFLYLAALILVLPLPWMIAASTAGAIHEAGHLIVLKSMRIPVRSIRLEAAGARITALPATQWQELACAAAGPAIGLLVSLLFPVFPRLAFCALAQSVFNLLPLMPFDGGRILRCSIELLLGQSRAERLFLTLERIACVILTVGGILLLRYSILFMAVCTVIVLRCVKERSA